MKKTYLTIKLQVLVTTRDGTVVTPDDIRVHVTSSTKGAAKHTDVCVTDTSVHVDQVK